MVRHRNPLALAWCLLLILLLTFLQGPARADPRAAASLLLAPPDSERDVLAGDVIMNGLPTRTLIFASRESAQAIKSWYRAHLPKPYVEDQVGQKTVFGRQYGQVFVTATIEPTLHGCKGVVSATDFSGVHPLQVQALKSVDQWMSQLPSDSDLVSHVYAKDAAAIQETLVATNRVTPKLNLNRIQRVLERQGFRVQMHVAPTDGVRGSAEGIFFQSPAKDGLVTALRGEQGQTIVTIQTTISPRSSSAP